MGNLFIDHEGYYRNYLCLDIVIAQFKAAELIPMILWRQELVN